MRFAHMADCHLGSWRDPKMQQANMKAFEEAIDICIEKAVDFILIAGDLFNTSVPGIDKLKTAFVKLDALRKAGIRTYFIPGSHDYSPSGKTMLELIELAGLGKNVMKGDFDGKIRLEFTVDRPTGAKITGLHGRKGGLDKDDLDRLDTAELEKEKGYKIFMFHTAITELKTRDLQQMDSISIDRLPKGFDYYAGGHVHIISADTHGKYRIAYPGPLFPNSFSEFEKLGRGGFYIVEGDKAEYIELDLFRHLAINFDCTARTPEHVQEEIIRKVENLDLKDTIVTLRLHGKLKGGRPSDIDYSEIYRQIYRRGAYFLMKNSYKVTSEEFEEAMAEASSSDDIEESVIKENLGKAPFFPDERKVIRELLKVFSREKKEGEKNLDYESRIRSEALDALGDLEP